MKHKIAKLILGFVLLAISPFLLLAIVGMVYVIFKFIGGTPLSSGIQSLVDLIQSLVPYFSYLTTIPIIVVAITMIVKNRHKIFHILQNR